jgi:hypothetical protein
MAKSKHQVIKPGHFKLAGRERPGHDSTPELRKQELKKAKKKQRVKSAPPAPGATKPPRRP